MRRSAINRLGNRSVVPRRSATSDTLSSRSIPAVCSFAHQAALTGAERSSDSVFGSSSCLVERLEPAHPVGDDVQQPLPGGHVVLVAGLDQFPGVRSGSVAGTPSFSVSQFLRSARWSASVLPDHLREVSTRRPA